MTDSIMRLLQGHMEEAALSSVGAGAEVGIWTSQVRYDALWYHPSRLINYKPLICILLSVCCMDYRQVSLLLLVQWDSEELFLCSSRQRASSHVTCHSSNSKKLPASVSFCCLPDFFLSAPHHFRSLSRLAFSSDSFLSFSCRPSLTEPLTGLSYFFSFVFYLVLTDR